MKTWEVKETPQRIKRDRWPLSTCDWMVTKNGEPWVFGELEQCHEVAARCDAIDKATLNLRVIADDLRDVERGLPVRGL